MAVVSVYRILFCILLLTTVIVRSIEPDDDPRNEGLNECTINSDVHMFCQDIKWSESTADEYNECVQRHNGYLSDYQKPPVPDDCTGGKSCVNCQQKLFDCECQCYDNCDGAYLAGMQILSAFLTIIVCLFCVFWAVKKKNQPPKNMTQEQMDSLIGCDMSALIDQRRYFGKIIEVKKDENENEMLYKIEFNADEKLDAWMKQNEINISDNPVGDDEEESWKFWLGLLICFVCFVFAIILWNDPLVFYPETETKRQEEKYRTWGIWFVVFGSIGACCCLLCACGARIQFKLDQAEERFKERARRNLAKRRKKEKSKGVTNDIELENVNDGDTESEKETGQKDVTVKVWIFRTIAFAICSTVFLIIGSLMMSGTFVTD